MVRTRTSAAALVGKLDFTRIGLMGHSRGGDAVTSFIDWNRERPAPGRRYPLRGVISLAPVDYERRAPYGMPYLTILPYCDGDVSNLQGARFFERSQYIAPGDPFPRIQMSLLGGNHNWFNTVWFSDPSDDSGGTDAACAVSQPNNIRLSGGAYTRETRGSGDPALMGDQEKAGLATMGAFFRRYVGGDVAFDPYMTGEVSADGTTPQLPASACPTSRVRRADPVLRPVDDELLPRSGRAPRRVAPRDGQSAHGQRARHRDHRLGLLEPVPRRRRHQPAAPDHRGRLRLVQPGTDALHARPGRRARPADGDQGLPACRPPARWAARTASASRRP